MALQASIQEVEEVLVKLVRPGLWSFGGWV